MSLTSLLSQFAAEAGCVDTAIFGQVCDNCNGSATMQILSYVVRAMTYGVGILAVIGILVFGIRYLTSRDDKNLAQKARRHLFQVLIGLASYVILVFTASWLLPGNLTTTMLGGNPGTCPETTKTDIVVIGEEGKEPTTDPTTPGTTTLSEGWKTGTRPRECGPGEPGDFQTLTIQKDEDNRDVWVYTNSVGRTFFQYKQSDSRWGPIRLNGCTISSCGCTKTTYAMASQSYASAGQRFTPNAKSDAGHSDNYTKDQERCSGDRDSKIKCTIDQGGVVIVVVCGHWGGSNYDCLGKKRNSHWFLLVDYRINNGTMEFFILNTDSNISQTSKWNGKGGTGWGTFGGAGVEQYGYYYQYPNKNAVGKDCKVR